MINLAEKKVPRETILTVWKERLPTDIVLLIDDEITEPNEKRIVEKADHVYINSYQKITSR